jgi:C4-dicarboxylate-specific signal transduction histidine kinase
MKYNKKFNQIIDKLSSIEDEECQNIREEMMTLFSIYKKKDKRLDRIIKLSDSQQMAIVELHEELESYKTQLEEKVAQEIQKRVAQEELLFEQSRLVAIAEMMNAVAHQWTQPLNILSMQMNILSLEANKNNGVSPETIKRFKEDGFLQIQHLTETLQNFRSFFKPIKAAKPFFLKPMVQSVLMLIKEELVKYAIEVSFEVEEDFEIQGHENEFKHILLNLINNAKYAFLEQKILNRKLHIKIDGKEKKLTVTDNAGGIPEEILDTLFEIHVTSKGDAGTGIGLYMSQQIAKKHQGFLSVANTKDGATFTFELKDTQ